MTPCPECERNKFRAAMWRAEAYKQAGNDVIERPWVGLTEEDWKQIWDEFDSLDTENDFQDYMAGLRKKCHLAWIKGSSDGGIHPCSRHVRCTSVVLRNRLMGSFTGELLHDVYVLVYSTAYVTHEGAFFCQLQHTQVTPEPDG